MKILYYDIDGTLTSYDDRVKPLFTAGAFERHVRANGINRLVCVSSWVSIFAELPAYRRYRGDVVPDDEITDRIFNELIADAFEGPEWFMKHHEIRRDNNGEHRARHLPIEDATADNWLYIDDWAREFVTNAHSEAVYNRLEGKHVLTCDPFGNGQDILDFIAARQLAPTQRG